MRLVLDDKVYSLTAVKKAAYRFLDRFSPDFRVTAEGIVGDLTFPPNISSADQSAIIADFRKEILDQELRELIGSETAAVRNAVLSIAFAPVYRDRE